MNKLRAVESWKDVQYCHSECRIVLEMFYKDFEAQKEMNKYT